MLENTTKVKLFLVFSVPQVRFLKALFHFQVDKCFLSEERERKRERVKSTNYSSFRPEKKFFCSEVVPAKPAMIV